MARAREDLVYHPEPYWSRVAQEIRNRGPRNLVAGDDNPYYRYKREKFLTRFLGTVDFRSKVVLEVGPGPGGNLLQVVKAGAQRVIGIDISQAMLDLAADRLEGHKAVVELKKTDGRTLPLEDAAVDLAFTVTVLHHNTDESMFQRMVAEIARVTRHTVVLFEDTARGPDKLAPDHSFMRRPVEAYRAALRKNGFELVERKYLGTRASNTAHWLVRHLLVPRSHHEGDPYEPLPIAVLNGLLHFTRPIDDLVTDDRELTKMVFERG